MIRYVPASAAEPLSDALWGLSRPPEVRQPDDTRYLFPWLVTLDNERWLIVDTEHEINVHPEAVLDGIADILQPWIDEGHLPVDTNANLAAFVTSLRGQRLIVWQAFPQLFKDLSLDLTGMIAAGKLPNTNPEVMP